MFDFVLNNIGGYNNMSVLFDSLYQYIFLNVIVIVQVRPPSPWMSNDIIVAKRRRRYFERIWRRTRSPIDRSRYTKQLHICNHMMSKAKSDYYTHFITTNSENPRQMWKSVNKILHRQKLKALPEHSSLDTLCSSFSKYFTDKIARIRSNFVINNNDYDFPEPPLSEKNTTEFHTCNF